MERGHGQDRDKIEQDPPRPRPERRRHDAGELSLQQSDEAGDDGQHREDPGSTVMPEGQRHENHDPGDVNHVKHRGPDAARQGGHQARGRRRKPEQAAAPGRPHEHIKAQHRVHQHHGEHRAPHRLPPGEVPARRARGAHVQPDGQPGHAGDLRPAGTAELQDALILVRVTGQPAVQEGGDHVLFPQLPVVAGQQPQHPPVTLLQANAAAHPAAPAAAGPARPSLARTTRAVAARSSASSASTRRPSRVSR